MIDGTILSTAVLTLGTGIGGWVGGRLTGRSVSSQVASDTVDMLQTQVDSLKSDKEDRELMLLDLQTRVTVLEGLVTQRADVEAVSEKVDMVKHTVDRIAERVGA